jgi:hypothetical protein
MLTTGMRRPLIVGTVAAGLLLTAAAPAMASSTDRKTVWIGDIPYAAGIGWVENHNRAFACDQAADGRGIRTEYTYRLPNGVIDLGSVGDGNGSKSGCGSGQAPGGPTMLSFRVCAGSAICTSWFSA